MYDVPEVPDGTWKIINNANNPAAPTSNLIVRLCVDGEDNIDVVISSLETEDILGGIYHAHSIYKSRKVISAITESEEITIIPQVRSSED